MWCNCKKPVKKTEYVVDNKVYVDGSWLYLFSNEEELDNTIWFEMDTDIGMWLLGVGEFLSIKDENARTAWIDLLYSLDAECAMILFNFDEGGQPVPTSQKFEQEAFDKINAFLKNPTEEQKESFRERLESKCAKEESIVCSD